ncbi:hypothetical protein DFJ77DRAFT_469870 [Powellomyces hirtus]|nr:hypothetical protein DFJ77DRAFT_469870 [Powellomyces hirtus]
MTSSIVSGLGKTSCKAAHRVNLTPTKPFSSTPRSYFPRFPRKDKEQDTPAPSTTPPLSYVRAPRPEKDPGRVHYPEPVIPRHRRVRINLDRIRSLSGFEKIELYRDFLRAKQVEDAVYVYTILKENELVARLKYQDYHELFHLLLTNASTYRNVMLDAISNMRRFGYSPTPSMLTILIKCCAKWRNLELARRAYDEMREKSIFVDVLAYNALLELYAVSQGATQLQRGAELWRDMVDRDVERNLETSIKAMEIFGRLNQVDMVKQIYSDAMEDLASNRPSPKHTSAPSKPTLDNAYLSALVSAGAYAEAKGFFQTFSEPGGLLAGEGLKAPKALVNTFNILLKMCVAQKDAQAAAVYWDQLTRRGLQPNVVTYGRMISILGTAGKLDSAQELFELAQERLPAKPGSKKLMLLRASLLAAYAQASDAKAARPIFDAMRADSEAVGKPVLRHAVYCMVMVDLRAKNLPGALKTWEDAHQHPATQATDPSDTADDSSSTAAASRGLTKADIIAEYQKLHPEQ